MRFPNFSPIVVAMGLLTSLAIAQEPSTTAAASHFPIDPQTGGIEVDLNIDCFERYGTPPTDVDALIEFIKKSLPQHVSLSTPNYSGSGATGAIYTIPLNLSFNDAIPRTADDVVQLILTQIKSLLTDRPKRTPAEMAAHLKQLQDQLLQLDYQTNALAALRSAQGSASKLLTAKLETLRSALQRLEMELASKQARRAALTKALAQQQEIFEKSRATDAIAEELRNLVKIRENEVRLSELRANAGAENGQLNVMSARAMLSDAKIRLAEREAQFGKAGKGDLLDRLTDELTMISVDVTDLELQKNQIESQLRQYDVTQITSDALKQMIQQDPALKTPEMNIQSPIWAEIEAKRQSIYFERFVTVVSDVSISPSPPKTPGGSGGRGRGAPAPAPR